MKTWRLGSYSDFNGVVKPLASHSYVSTSGMKVYSSSTAAAFCLPDSFLGCISFCGCDVFAFGVMFEGLSNDSGSFGLTWDDVMDAYTAAGFEESDDEPMIESKWFDALCDDFASWTLSKLAF